MSEEITGALRNALDRGQSLESAKQTLLRAGYSQSEVEGAASMLNIHSSAFIGDNILPPKIQQQKPEPLLKLPLPNLPPQVQQNTDKKLWVKVGILAGILIVLIVLAVYLYSTFS